MSLGIMVMTQISAFVSLDPTNMMIFKVFCCCLCFFFVQNGSSNGALLIKNAQLKHAGRYTCMAQTPIDNATESAQLVVRGKSWPVVTFQYCVVRSSLGSSHNRFFLSQKSSGDD